MENRIGNIIIGSPGGTAAKSARTYKIALASSWVKELGITENQRQVLLSFDGSTITIAKIRTLQDFIEAARSQGHELTLLSFYDGQELCSRIAADYTTESVCSEDKTTDVLKTAFGNNPAPSWSDYISFLEERCIPKTRAGLREYLDAIGADQYDPLQIIRKTQGRMAEDRHWIKVEELT